jgi:glutamate-1-semialdehyde 2,1-aminomutase
MTLKNTKSKELFNRSQNLFPGGVNSPVRAFKAVGCMPFVVARGAGAYLYDVDGNEYVDFINSWGPLVLGHANPVVVKAISDQAAKGTSYGALAELEIELAELIKIFMPNLEMLRFVNSGTEAGMSVLRLARAYTKKNKIIKFSGCYHGHCDSLLVDAGSGLATLSISSSAGVPANMVQDTLIAEFNNATSVEALFSKHKDQIAAVIVEPVPGNMGLVQPESGFLDTLRALCDEHQSLLIFDEVMSGFRVSLGGAQHLFSVKPDLTMLGKVIGGGLPVGAFGGRRDIMELLAPLGSVYQAGTLSGNPLAMAAGLATLKEWTKPGVFSEVRKACSKFVIELAQMAQKHSIPLSTKALGSMFGFSFRAHEIQNYEQAKQYDNQMFVAFFQQMLNRGVYFAPSAFEAGFMCTEHIGAPLEKTLRVAGQVFEQMSKELIKSDENSCV